MVLVIESGDNVLTILQIIVAVFTMIYSYDVLILHRRYKALGTILGKHALLLSLGIFITISAFAIESFGYALFWVNLAEIIGIFSIGLYFRRCMHEFFTKPIHVHS